MIVQWKVALQKCSIINMYIILLTLTFGLAGASTRTSVDVGPYCLWARDQLALISISSRLDCPCLNGLPVDTHNTSSFSIAENFVTCIINQQIMFINNHYGTDNYSNTFENGLKASYLILTFADFNTWITLPFKL
jgi:hypothetical protein